MMQGKRQEIADALDTVPGVRGFRVRPSAASTGDGWPQWGGARRPDSARGMFTQVWRALIRVPGDEVAADEWVDAHIDDLADALRSVGYMTECTPVNLTGTDNTPIRALMITMECE